MANFLITGGSGLVGRALISKLLAEGHQVRALARTPEKLKSLLGENVFKWSHNEEPPLEAFIDVDVIVHLAGEGIADKRWTASRKKTLFESRVQGTKNMVSALNQYAKDLKPGRVFISASATGFYGSGSESDEILTEDSHPGQDFLSDLCQNWEQEAFKAKEGRDIRVALLRTSMVLSRDGGALKKMPPIILGQGQQWMSWIHIDDMVNLILWLAQTPQAQGVFNVTALTPVRNKEFVKQLAKVKRVPLTLSAPAWALKLGLGEMSSVLLSSQRVVPQKAISLGFKFTYPEINQALDDLCKK